MLMVLKVKYTHRIFILSRCQRDMGALQLLYASARMFRLYQHKYQAAAADNCVRSSYTGSDELTRLSRMWQKDTAA